MKDRRTDPTNLWPRILRTGFDVAALLSVSIPNEDVVIRSQAFYGCTNLAELYFGGNSPHVELFVFRDANEPRVYEATVFYLPNTEGWSNTFAGRPTAIWQPWLSTDEIQLEDSGLQFKLPVRWSGNRRVELLRSNRLEGDEWDVVGSITLTNGWGVFREPLSATAKRRFYKLRSDED